MCDQNQKSSVFQPPIVFGPIVNTALQQELFRGEINYAGTGFGDWFLLMRVVKKVTSTFLILEKMVTLQIYDLMSVCKQKTYWT